MNSIICATEPNELVATIHDRLALILKPSDYERWLTTGEEEDPSLPLDLLHPFDSDKMKMVPANPILGVGVREIAPEGVCLAWIFFFLGFVTPSDGLLGIKGSPQI